MARKLSNEELTKLFGEKRIDTFVQWIEDVSTSLVGTELEGSLEKVVNALLDFHVTLLKIAVAASRESGATSRKSGETDGGAGS